MPAPSILNQLKQDYPDITFAKGDTFHWSPNENTVYYGEPIDIDQLLHETGHAILKHQAYTRDIVLLKMERDAWTQATKLASDYGRAISDEKIENALDSYRDWLHSRSTCPTCSTTGIQKTDDSYYCPSCRTVWHVNDARRRKLRRTIQK